MNVMKLAEDWFAFKLRPDKVEKAVQRCLAGHEHIPERHHKKDEVLVACVQRSIKTLRTVKAYAAEMEGAVREAALGGAELVVFPEYNFFDMFAFIPLYPLINNILRIKQQKHIRKSAESVGPEPEGKAGKAERLNTGEPAGLGAVFYAIAKPVEHAVNTIMSKLAEAYGVYVYTGSYVLREGKRVYNAGSLYAPGGERMGTQKKLHMTQEEDEMGISRGNSLNVFKLPFGAVAMPVCMDATYFETFRIASEKGAEIVILPISNGEEYAVEPSLRGIWGRVQESYVYGLKASQNGWVAGIHFTGVAGIFAPLSMTDGKNGAVTLSAKPEGDSLAMARLDLKALREARESAEYYGDTNPAFEAGYVEKAYGRLTPSRMNG